ncbi:MAG: hypothetical protein Q7S53_01820 [bacterium]|nr:hypothetical protein [bacterium]
MKKLRGLIKKVKKKFFNKKPEETLSENSLSLFNYDRHVVETAVESNPELSKLIERGEKDLKGFNRLFEDIYGALQKQHPTILAEESIAKEYRANREHLKDIMDSEDYDDLRQTTKLNKSLALATAQDLARKILENSPDETEKRRELEKEKDRLEQLIERAEGLEGEGASEDHLELYAEAIEKAAADIEKLEEEAAQITSNYAQREALKEDLEETAEKATGLVEMLHSFGYSQEELERVSPDRMLRMLDSVYDHRQLKDMMEIIGRFRKLARDLLSKATQKDHFTISGVGFGDDIADMTDYEAISAMHPALQKDFLSRWSDGELEVYVRDDDIPSGKGPMIICDDISGTMKGTRDSYAKGLIMACLEIARKEHRDMHIIYYESSIKKEVSIRKGKIRPEELIEALVYFTGGGTNFERPLARTAELVRSSQMKKADVLFLTDGIAPISDEFAQQFAKERKRLEFKVVSVLIGDDLRGEQKEESVRTLKSVSDYHLDAKDLTTKNAKEVIGSMLN